MLMFLNVASLACCGAVCFPTPCRSLSRVVGSVVRGRPCQPAVAVGAVYSSMAILCRCVIRHSHHMTKQIPTSFDSRQAHWAALASFIAGDFLRISDGNDLPQLTSVKCINTSPFGWCQPPRIHVVREYRDYKCVVQPRAQTFRDVAFSYP